MNSKERIRAAINRKSVDILPCDFSATAPMYEKIMKHYGISGFDSVQDKFGSDFRYISPSFTGSKLKDYIDSDG